MEDPLAELGSRIMVLAKGDAGTAKSVTLASWKPPVYVLDIDDRYEAIASYYQDRPDILKNIEYDMFYTEPWKSLQKKLDELLQYQHFNSIIVDGLTLFCEKVVGDSLDSRKSRRGNLGANINEIVLPEWEDWHAEDRAVKKLMYTLKKLHALGANVFLTSHILAEESSRSRRLSTGARKAALFIPGLFNNIWHFEKEEIGNDDDNEETRYLIATNRGGLDPAKSTLPIPKYMDVTNQARSGEPSAYEQYASYIKKWYRRRKLQAKGTK